MTSKTLIRALEERSFRAWPALEVRHYDGWVLRFANGYTRRSNSVNPIYGSMLDVSTKIAHCESLYRAKGLSIHFKMTDAACPEDLDSILGAKGYIRDSGVSIQTLDLSQPMPEFGTDVTIDHDLSDTWLGHFMRMTRRESQLLPTIRCLLSLIPPQRAFMSLQDGGKVVTVGLGVCDGKWVGLFDIVTDERYRRQGFGRAMVENLLAWGRMNGAQRAYLQVHRQNDPALALYDKIGFREVYRYWYRQKL